MAERYTDPDFFGENVVSVPQTHALSELGMDVMKNGEHYIITDTPGYVFPDDETQATMTGLGLIVPQVSTTADKAYMYHVDDLTSAAGFLNSTRADSRGPEKRRRFSQKIDDALGLLASTGIYLRKDGKFTYKDLAIRPDFTVVFLPNGLRFVKSSGEMTIVGAVIHKVRTEITESIQLAADNEDVSMFGDK